MSNDLNLCQFIGHLGKDPEVRYMANGDAVANFSIGVSWKGKDKEGTEWVRCTAFGKLGEVCGQYLKKGKQVYVAGRMSTRKWQDKDGHDKYTTEINVDRMQMLGGKDGGERSTEQTQRPASKQAAPQTGADFDDMDSDIPF